MEKINLLVSAYGELCWSSDNSDLCNLMRKHLCEEIQKEIDKARSVSSITVTNGTGGTVSTTGFKYPVGNDGDILWRDEDGSIHWGPPNCIKEQPGIVRVKPYEFQKESK